MGNLKDRYAIVGIGETKFGKLPESSGLALALEASKKAIEDGGFTNAEIDGLLTQQPYLNPALMYSSWIAEGLGVNPKYTTDLNIGGATPISMITHAVLAIEAGMCETVLCVFAEDALTGFKTPTHGRSRFATEDFERPFGRYIPPGLFALSARRHMHEYGTTPEQLGAVAVTMRKHAAMNDNAQMRDPITIDDYLKSRWIVEPLRLLDCALMTDGGAAVVVTSAERAKDLKNPPIYIMGFGQGFTKFHINHPEKSLTSFQAIEGSKKRAFKMADITLEDIDVAEIYDCFTITVIITLEDYGFCEKGEGGPFVEAGKIEIGGEFPINTHGGLLSQGHVDGMNHITEAVKQLRGVCGKRQVKDAEIALVTGHGGEASTSHSTLILRR